MRWMLVPSLYVAAAIGIALPAAVRAQQAADTATRPSAPPSAANIALARQLLKAMHADDNLVSAIQTNITAQRKVNTQIAPVFYDSVMARMKRTAHEIVDSIAPLYARRMSGPELQAMIQFYESPAGQTLAREQSALTTEVSGIGQRWGVRLGSDVAKDLVNAGIDIQAH